MSKYKAGDVVVVVDNSGHQHYYHNGEICTVELVDEDGYSERNTILRCVGKEAGMFSYRFKLASEVTYNGVDASGNPLNFTNEMMKPFMRVIRSEGTIGIAIPSPSDGLVVVGKFLNGCTWSSGQDYLAPIEKYNEIIEVYDAPFSPGDLLNADSKGNLIWKRTKPITEQEKAMQQLENTIKEAQEKLEALKATL